MGRMTDGNPEIEREAAQIRQERERLDVAAAALQRRTADLLARLPRDVSLREAGALVGLSYQRVDVIRRKAEGRPRPGR